MNEKRCSVRSKESGWYIVGQGIDVKRGWTCMCGPLLALPPDAKPDALGRAIRQSLDGFRLDVPEGENSWRNVLADLWAAGVRGWSGLKASSRSFTIDENGHLVTIHPHEAGEAVSCDGNPDEIGRVLLELLPRCTPSPPLTTPRPGHSYPGKRPSDGRAEEGRSFELENLPVSFGYKTDWLAIDTEDTKAVVEALGLIHVEQVSWAEGVYKGTFVAPPILGWTLVEGVRLEPGEPRFVPFLEDLSRRFGEVQYFGTHRVVGYSAWAKAVDGRIVRGYGWVGDKGEVLLDVGPRTIEEEELGFRFVDRTTVNGDWEDIEVPDEEDVMRIAGRWSLNPQEIDAYESKVVGFLGDQP